MRPWMRFLAIATVVGLVAAIAVHVYDCDVGTHEACLMSQGLLWVYWIVFFVVAGIPVAIIAEVARNVLRRRRQLHEE